MFEKSKQHIRILKKLKSLRGARNVCPKGSDERADREHAYLHVRDRYLGVVLGVRNKEGALKRASKRYKRKFLHLGWGFVLRQAVMGIVTPFIRKFVQFAAFYLLALGGVKITEHKLEQSPTDMTEVQAMRSELTTLKEQLRHLTAIVQTKTQQQKDTSEQITVGLNKDEANTQTVLKQTETQGKYEHQKIKSDSSEDKKAFEFKSAAGGITRVGSNKFAYKFFSHKERVS